MSTVSGSPIVEALSSYAIDTFATANRELVEDLNALSEEILGTSWSGSRTAYDFAYEVGLLNRRIALICREEDAGPWPWDFGKEWLKVPDELQSKAAIVRHIEESGQELLDSVGSDLTKVVTFQGVRGAASRPIYQLVLNAAKHVFYHDAQLNFMQEMTGDMEVHWT